MPSKSTTHKRIPGNAPAYGAPGPGMTMSGLDTREQRTAMVRGSGRQVQAYPRFGVLRKRSVARASDLGESRARIPDLLLSGLERLFKEPKK